MIKVFYCGYGYVSQVNEQGFNKDLANATLSKYSGYFLMDSSVVDVLEHFDVTTISRLDFIYDKLPRGITKDLAHGNRFGLASDIANARFGRIYYQFELRKGVRKYGYDHNKTFTNALHILDNAPQNTTASSENKTTTAPPVQQDNVPQEKTSLLNTPKRQDEWFEVINETVNQFYAENEVMPTATQVWNLLSTQPPTGYAITTGNDKGEICLNMAGCRLLSKSAFQERWRKYTK